MDNYEKRVEKGVAEIKSGKESEKGRKEWKKKVGKVRKAGKKWRKRRKVRKVCKKEWTLITKQKKVVHFLQKGGKKLLLQKCAFLRPLSLSPAFGVHTFSL